MTNRISYAWGVLRHGVPNPEVVYLVGGTEQVTLYCVRQSNWPNISWRFYKTCAEAHAANPGCEVTSTSAFKSGDKYFHNIYLYEIQLERKRKQRVPVESLGRGMGHAP